MAYWTGTPTQFVVSYIYGGTTSIATGGANIPLSTFGIRPVGWGVTAAYSEAKLPQTDGAIEIHDGTMQGDNMIFTGANPGGDDPHETLELLQLINQRIVVAADDDFSYMQLGHLDGGSVMQSFRKYGRITNARQTYARKTQTEAVQNIQINFRAYDPALYSNTIDHGDITITAGTGNVALVNAGLPSLASKRARITITKNGADDPTNPTITNVAGDSMTITGTLVGATDKWEIDTWDGSVTKTVSAVASNDIANVAGQFLAINSLFDLVTVTDTAASDFDADVDFLPRYW